MHITTPSQISPAVHRLVARVSPGAHVQIDGRGAEPDAVVNECFPNVDAKIARHGGRMLCGWQVWEWPHVMIEAEFHAIWVSPADEWVEITPKPGGEARILFVPAPGRTYSGRAIDNVRLPLRDDQMIRHFIRVAELKTKVLNRGERAEQYGHVSVPAHEIEPLLEIQQALGEALYAKRRDHDPCPCGSGGKYKRCHGRQWQALLGD